MLKLGVVSRGAFADRALELERSSRGWWPVAYTLIDDINDSYSERDQNLLERLYCSLPGGDGIYKITRDGRFSDLDAALARQIDQRFAGAEIIDVHDMAASNAVTSLAMFRTLQRSRRIRVHASDYYDAIHVLTFSDTRWRVVLDTDLRPLQFVGYRLVLSATRPESLRYPINRIVQAYAKYRLSSRLNSDQLQRGELPNGATLRRVMLFHPAAMLAADTEQKFTLARDDLFAPQPRPVHVIRVMNALTRRHFPDPRIAAGIRAVSRNLVDGGLLVLGRNVDEENGQLRATIYARTGTSLTPVEHLGDGYEHSHLATLHGILEPA